MSEDMETYKFIKIGNGFDFLYHFNVRYSFKHEGVNYKGYLYYFSNMKNINESSKSIMTHMFNTVLMHIKDHHDIKTRKGEQLEIAVNFDRVGKLGFKDIEDEFLTKLPINNDGVKWC